MADPHPLDPLTRLGRWYVFAAQLFLAMAVGLYVLVVYPSLAYIVFLAGVIKLHWSQRHSSALAPMMRATLVYAIVSFVLYVIWRLPWDASLGPLFFWASLIYALLILLLAANGRDRPRRPLNPPHLRRFF